MLATACFALRVEVGHRAITLAVILDQQTTHCDDEGRNNGCGGESELVSIKDHRARQEGSNYKKEHPLGAGTQAIAFPREHTKADQADYEADQYSTFRRTQRPHGILTQSSAQQRLPVTLHAEDAGSCRVCRRSP